MKQGVTGFLVCMIAILLLGCQSTATLATHNSAFPYSAAKIEKEKQPLAALPVKRWTTANGSEVLFVANSSLPMVDLQLTFAAGSSRDQGVAGLAKLVSNLIGEDAQGGLTSDDIARGFDKEGSVLSTGSYHDMGIISLTSLSDPAYFEPSMDLFLKILSPAFTQDDINRVRTQMLQGLKMAQQVPGPITGKTYWKTVFAGHPYAHPSAGTLKSLPTITRQQLQAFYRSYYAAGNVVISLVGDLTVKQAHELATKISKALPGGKHAKKLKRAQPLTSPQIHYVHFDSSQTHILIGNQAIYRGVPEWPALYVGNWILGGGGFASRLTQQVREKKGYVYGIYSSLSPMAAGGPFTIGLQTANKNAQEALDLTLKVADKFLQQGPTKEEVKRAIDHITGSFPLSLASNDAIVSQLGAIGFYGLPSDYLKEFVKKVRQVTPADVKAAMDRYIDPDDFTLVVTGPHPLSRPGTKEKQEQP